MIVRTWNPVTGFLLDYSGRPHDRGIGQQIKTDGGSAVTPAAAPRESVTRIRDCTLIRRTFVEVLTWYSG